MQPIAAFAVAELMMIDDNSILMLCCMVGATFYFSMLQLRASTLRMQLSGLIVFAMGAMLLGGSAPSRS